MKFRSAEWYVTAMRTIDAVVREIYPRTRPNGSADPEIAGNLMYHAVENGTDADGLREVLRASPEFEANQKPAEPEPEPVPEPAPTALALPVRATSRGWADQTGIRPMLFASWFPMLRILRDEPDRFYRTLDMLRSWGVQGVRVFAGVCHPNYWRGREVLPVRAGRVGDAWPDYEALVQTAAKACMDRGIAWFVTAGDLQEFDDEAAVYARVFRALDAAGLLDVVAVADVNELWQNSRRGNDPKHAAALLRPFRERGIAWATSAHPPEGNGNHGDDHDQIDKMWIGVAPNGGDAPVATLHGPGGTTLMVRHIINHRHNSEGVGFRVALMQGEPRGPGNDVSAGQVNHPSWVVLAAAASAMTGQLYVLHCSRGIRDRDDDDPWYAFAPYFQRAAALLQHIPRSRVLVSAHGGGGGNRPDALFASTRADGAFHEDRPGITGEFHRCDAALYENGQRACLLYGGIGDRGAKAVRATAGTFYNTHGAAVRSVQLTAGEIVRFTSDEAGDGLLYVER